MNKQLKVAVLGAGNGGQAMAGWLSSCGCEVRITDLFPEYLAPLSRIKEIEIAGAIKAKGKVAVFKDQAKCVQGVDIIIMATAAPGHRKIIEKIAPALADGQVLLTTPGYFSSLTVPACLEKLGYRPKLVYAETESLIYTCRAKEPGKVAIYYVKNEMGIGIKPGKEARRVLEMLKPFYPQLKDEGNIFQIAMDNVNFSLHPSILLLNSGWAENTRGNWIFYRDGVSPSVIRVVEALDAERLNLGKAAGLKLTPVYELLRKFYTVPGENNLLSLLQRNPAYQDIKAPSILDYRYFNEDICYGLIPLSALAKKFGFATPVMDSIIQLASVLLGKNFYEMGLQLSDLGLTAIGRQNLIKMMKAGE